MNWRHKLGIDVYGFLIGAVVVCLLVACGGKADVMRTTEQNKTTSALLTRAGFTAHDFPNGWTIDKNRRTLPACFSRLVKNTRVKESESYSQAESRRVASSVIAEVVDKGAIKAVSMDPLKYKECGVKNVKTRLRNGAVIKRITINRFDLRIKRWKIPAIREKFTVKVSHRFSVTIYDELVVVQRQRAIAWLLFEGLVTPFDKQLEQDLVQTVASRLEATA